MGPHRIAFFWVGADITPPSLLVRSIRTAFGPDIGVVQLTDIDTPEVPGVTLCKRMKLPPQMMVARLKAYAALPIDAPTLYLDADMMVMRHFELPDIGVKDIGVTGREHDIPLNWQYPMDYPEFKGRNASDVMKYLYSFVYVRTEAIFHRQLAELMKMPRRYHEWYGDQATLHRLVKRGQFTAIEFEPARYNKAVDNLLDLEDARKPESDVCILHFKGRASKELLHYLAASD